MGFHTYLTWCKHVETIFFFWFLSWMCWMDPAFWSVIPEPLAGGCLNYSLGSEGSFIIPELLFLRWWLQYFLNIGDVLENQNILKSCRTCISCLHFNAWLLWSLSVSSWDPQEVGSTPLTWPPSHFESCKHLPCDWSKTREYSSTKENAMMWA